MTQKMKAPKKLLSILLTLAMLLGMLPAMSLTAFAAEPGITLAGSDSSGTGWSYTESSQTLTLSGYNGGYIQGSGLSTLNLVLEGTSTITVDDANAKGIALGNNQNLNISGSGSLTINATGGTNLIYGIECNKFTMTSGTVTINANSSKMVYGVNANDSLSVTGGKLTANITGTSDGRGLYCKTGKLTVDSGAEVDVTVTNNGSNSMHGIYNEAYIASVTDNGDIELAGTVTITRGSGSTGSGMVYGIANSGSSSNTDGVISITGGTVTVTNASYGIIAFTKGHAAAFADVVISGGTVNVTSTTSDSLGIVSWNNGVTISGGTVTASTASKALWLVDNDSANKNGLVKITGGAKVSLTSTGYKALVVQGDESTSSTRVHQINLTSGGRFTAKSEDTGANESYPVQGYFSLGSSTKITEGSFRSTPDGTNAGGGKLFQSDNSTKQVVVAYCTAYTGAGAVSVNGHSFAPDKLYYKNGSTDTTDDSTDYNAHYDPATGVLELKDYNSGPIIIGGSNAYDLTVKLTGTNTVTTSAPRGGIGNVCVGINITNADNVTFIGDGTLTVNTNAGSGLTQVFGIWLDRSAAAAENLTFQSGKVTVNVTAADTAAQVFGVSTVKSSVGGPITVAEGAELNVTLSSASTGFANGLYSKGDITLNGKTAITLTYTGSGSPSASNWTSVSGFFEGNKLNVGANAAITVDMPDTYSLTNGMGSAYYAAKSGSQIGNGDWTNTTASEQYFENDSFLVTQSVKSGYGYADYKYEVITPLTFEDKADYDIPAGTKGTGYTATVALTATGGSGEYRYEFEGTKPSDLSINAENKLVYTRSSLCDATTAIVKVTDKGGISKSITIDIGAVTEASPGTETVPNIENKTVTVGTDVFVPWPEGAISYQRFEDSTQVGSGDKSGYPSGMYIPAKSSPTTKTFMFKVEFPGGWVDSNEFTVTWTAPVTAPTSIVIAYSAENRVGLNSSTGYYLVNGAAAASGTLGSDGCTAYYNESTGTLYLNGFNGGAIYVYGSNNKKLTIDLTGTNYASTLDNGSGNGCTFEITSSTNGKLIIDSAKESGTIIGISTGSASSETTGSVILSGSADVSVTLQHSGEENINNYAYAIYANEGIEIKDSASFTAKLKTKTAGPDRANGLYLTTKASGSKIVINTTGNVSIDTSEDTANYSAPIYNSSSAGEVKLQNVGKMTLKYKKYGTYGKDSYPDVTYATEDFTKNSVEEANIITTTYEAAAAAYTVTVQNDGNGSGSATPATAAAGTEITLSATANSGYHFKEWQVVSGSVTITGNKFTMPASNVTVKAIFEADTGGVTKLDKPTNLVWDGTTAKWDAVTGADKYRVILYANEDSGSGGFSLISNTDITTNSKDFSEYMLPGMYYYFEVAAYNSANQSGTFSGFDSSAKKQMPGSIGTVTGFAWSGNTISWTAVEGATGYDVWVMKDGTQYGSVRNISGTSFDLTSDIASGGDGTYYVSVSAYKLARGNYLAEGNSPAKIIGTTPAYSATVGNVSVNGTIGIAITETQVVINLTNDTFVSALSGNWITNLPAGLSQSVSYGGTTMAIITISGTPTAVSTEQIAITIPADQLIVNTENLNVTANANAKFNISAPTYTVTINAGANMTLSSGNANQSGLSGAMTDTVYTAADGYYFPTDYAVAAVNGINVTRNSYTQITVSGTPTANTTITLTPATAKTKEATPTATFDAQGPDSGNLMNWPTGMKYSVDGGVTWTENTSSNDYKVIYNVSDDKDIKVYKPASDPNTKLDSDIQTIDVTKAATPTGVIGVACTTSSNNDGKLQNVTTAMQYKKSDASSWTDGTGSEITDLVNGTYYVRTKASGTALSSDYVSVTIAASGATALTGTVTISGTPKYGETLTAAVVGSNNSGTLSYQWKRGTTNIGTNSDTYTLVEADIGNTITVTVTSSVETGEIVSGATGTIAKADGPAAPSGLVGVAPTTMGGNGKITGTTVAMEYSTSDTFTSATDCTATETEVTPGTYYVRVKATATHEASTATTVTVPAYTDPGTTYTVSFNANGGSGTMTAVTDVSGSYTLPANGFTAPAGKQFKAWSVGGTEYAVGASITVSADTTVTAIWEDIPVTEYNIIVTDGKATIGAGVEVSKAAEGTEVTLTANAAPSGKVFDKWVVESGSITLANENNATTTFAMPASAVSVKATYKDAPAETYTITFNANGGTVTPANGTTGTDGKLSSLPTPTRSSSYSFKGWYTAASGGTQVTTSTVFSANMTIYAQWNYNGGGGSGGSYDPTYSITADKTENGTVSVDPKSASNGDTVTITAKPDEGYELGELIVTDSKGNEIKLVEKDGKYTFTMPASKTSVKATFKEIEKPAAMSFADVAEGAWYYDSITYVYQSGMMVGTSGTTFSPDATTTRGMIVTILYRLEGEPDVSGKSTFDDVANGRWYADAVKWAAENEIVGGYGNGKFAPEDPISREQMAAILYRYAAFKGYDMTKTADLSKFTDSSKNSDWSKAALSWANAEGLINGKGGGILDPLGKATRAEVASILYRFCENVVK